MSAKKVGNVSRVDRAITESTIGTRKQIRRRTRTWTVLGHIGIPIGHRQVKGLNVAVHASRTTDSVPVGIA